MRLIIQVHLVDGQDLYALVSAWNAVFGTLVGTIEFMLETYRNVVYTVNEVFVKGTGVFIDLLGEKAWIRKKKVFRGILFPTSLNYLLLLENQ